jgi:intracellular sulfur oxidation DsrE/DsrF family protein
MTAMKTTLLLAAAVTLFLGYAAVSQAPATGPKHHVAFQLSEADDTAWNSVVVHVNNTMKALAGDGGSQVEVVFWGPGLDMLKKTNTAYEERLKQLSDHGVKLLACQNAMKNRKVTTEDLFPFAGQVDSGIAEIVRKQESGWAYIH